MKDIRIGIMTTLWKRPELSRIVLSWYTALEIKGVELVCLAAGSEGKRSETLAKDCGWYYVSARNNPLGAKHNKALRSICTLDNIDAVVIIGSDDLCNREYFEHIRDEIRDDADEISMEGIYYHDLATGKTAYVDRINPGAGRVLSYSFCKMHNFKAWPDEANNMLDGKMHGQILQHAMLRRSIHNPDKQNIVVLDIKGSDTNMWTQREMNERVRHMPRTELDTKEFFNNHFPGILEKLNAIKQKEKNGS